VTHELTILIAARGKPQVIVSDHSTKFTSNAILGRAIDHLVAWHYIAPASRWRTATSNPSTGGCATSFSVGLFLNLDHTRQLMPVAARVARDGIGRW
jgi:putative transposase